MRLASILVAICAAEAFAGTTPEDGAVIAKSNDSTVSELMIQIAGHEGDPAEKVFRNIRIPWLKNVPAGTFLTIMKDGYAAALGVRCEYCHVEGDFSKDDKRPKRAAREMAAMHHGINQQLAKMQELKPRPGGRFINCSTCHRGAVSPLSDE